MQGSAGQATVMRIVTGDGCEGSSCYQTATWVIFFNEETYRLCAKHAMIKMRDASIWVRTTDGKIETSAD